MSYEKEQQNLQKLWDDVLSASEDDFSASESDYEPSDSELSTSEEDPETPRKKIRITLSPERKFKQALKSTENLPSTSAKRVVFLDAPSSRPELPTASPSTNNIDEIIEQVIQQNINYSDEGTELEKNSEARSEVTWSDVTGVNFNNIPFTVPNPGICTPLFDFFEKSPYEFYKMLVTDEIFDLFVSETNLYAEQQKSREKSSKARIQKWKSTDRAEMEKFVGCIMWMGLVQLPSISAYWSTNKIYSNFIKSVMPRNRFQLLLKTWHFANNEDIPENDRLYKISPLISKLIMNFQAAIVPGEFICIDETLVPFKGRLKFKQYISNKRHKFGIKLFKLCLENGYLFDLSIYCGQEKIPNQEQSVPSSVVLKLTEKLLNQGRTIVIDNYYTSVELATALLEKKSYILGTLRSNRKNNSKTVTQKKLKRGEHIAEESNNGIYIEKWKDRRDVFMLTTKYVPEMVTQKRRAEEITKPRSIIEYNKHKAYIDISDQMKSYNSSLRRGVKWYRKLAIELVVGSTIVNAYVLHQQITNDKMSITKFREEVIKGLLACEELPVTEKSNDSGHILEDSDKKRSCSGCYSKISRESGRKIAKNRTPKTKFRCNICQKHFCLQCFFAVHVSHIK